MFESIIRQNLVTLATAYAKATGMSVKGVSFKFYSYSAFFDELAKGKRSCSLRIAQGMMERFAREWPNTEPWPMLKQPSFERVDYLPKARNAKRIAV